MVNKAKGQLNIKRLYIILNNLYLLNLINNGLIMIRLEISLSKRFRIINKDNHKYIFKISLCIINFKKIWDVLLNSALFKHH